MIEYYKAALSKYADFTGRSRRSEFWFFALGNIIIMMLLYIPLIGSIMASDGGDPGVGSFLFTALIGIFALAIIIPSLAVAVRRLHDTGKSGWFYLLNFVPFGGIVLLVFYCQDSEPGANKWGPNPKTGAVADASSHLVD